MRLPELDELSRRAAWEGLEDSTPNVVELAFFDIRYTRGSRSQERSVAGVRKRVTKVDALC